MLADRDPESCLQTAVEALHKSEDWKSALDELPLPIYTTDASGTVTHYNPVAAEFAGFAPETGSAKWCVSWAIYTTAGESLPHDECPMARAIKEQRPIRNEIIIVARPDGQRVACRPYPTPLFDEDGKLAGAVNLLVDITQEQCGELADQAARCRRLARSMHDPRTCEILSSMARGYDATAATLKSPD